MKVAVSYRNDWKSINLLAIVQQVSWNLYLATQVFTKILFMAVSVLQALLEPFVSES